MVSGRHPFTGGDLEEVQSRIRRADVAVSILTAPRSRRPGTAPAFAAALAAVSGNA